MGEKASIRRGSNKGRLLMLIGPIFIFRESVLQINIASILLVSLFASAGMIVIISSIRSLYKSKRRFPKELVIDDLKKLHKWDE